MSARTRSHLLLATLSMSAAAGLVAGLRAWQGASRQARAEADRNDTADRRRREAEASALRRRLDALGASVRRYRPPAPVAAGPPTPASAPRVARGGRPESPAAGRAADAPPTEAPADLRPRAAGKRAISDDPLDGVDLGGAPTAPDASPRAHKRRLSRSGPGAGGMP